MSDLLTDEELAAVSSPPRAWTTPAIEELRQRVADLEASRGDDEAAHGEEDALRESVLRAIADGSATGDEAREMARIALSTEAIDFNRWCA